MKKYLGVLYMFSIIIWMLIIFVFSSMPSEESNGKSKAVIRNVIEKTIIENSIIDENINVTADNSIIEEKHSKTESMVENLNRPLRKCMHATEYLILAILIHNCFKLYKLKRWKCIVFPIAISFLYACTDEFHQLFVTGRTSQLSDVMIDTFGAVIGIFIINTILYLLAKKKDTL